jgi:DNA-binding IclR family transcriptional regulator
LLTLIEFTENEDVVSSYHVPNLKRALLVLELLSENRDGMSLSGIAETLSVPKNSIFRITATLLASGYILRNHDKKFVLTRKLLAIGSSAISEYSLVEKSFDIMCQLRDLLQETVLIGTIAQNEFIVMEQAAGKHPFKFMLDPGSRVSLHTAAPAKAIMAYLPEKQIEQLLHVMDFKPFNQRTITNPARFRVALEEVRKQGYAIDQAEELDGVYCIGAPIFDRYNQPVASIWTTRPGDRFPESMFETLGHQIRKFADKISQRLV